MTHNNLNLFKIEGKYYYDRDEVIDLINYFQYIIDNLMSNSESQAETNRVLADRLIKAEKTLNSLGFI